MYEASRSEGAAIWCDINGWNYPIIVLCHARARNFLIKVDGRPVSLIPHDPDFPTFIHLIKMGIFLRVPLT
jgi:hypothetical protein